MDASDETTCVLCNGQLETGETVTLGDKGVKGLKRAAEDRKQSLYVKPGQKVHTNCRKRYTDPKTRKKISEPYDKVSLRSGTVFSYKDDCLFCGKSINKT